MSATEILVIVLGLVAGFMIVTRLMGDEKPKSRSASTPDSRAGEYDENNIPQNWHRILGVSPTATREQVVTAYQNLIRQYHPDKVAQMGTEIRSVAERKSKSINAAYDYAVRHLGIR